MTQTPTRTSVSRDDVVALMSRLTGDEKHSVAATSTLDVVHTLYDGVLNVSPDRIDDPDRDRFYLSKGHGPMAYYAVLAAHGFFPSAWLDGFAGIDSPLGHHPDRLLVPGVEISAGSLGHGLPLGVGAALALRVRAGAARVFVLVGDAELDEGSNAEAIEYAGGTALARLTAVVIDNNSSSYTVRGRIEQRFAVNGWDAVRVDGRDPDRLREALDVRDGVRPRVVVAQVEDK